MREVKNWLKHIQVDDWDNSICAVCLKGETELNNDILFCDCCDISVHQKCYGGAILQRLPAKNEEWYCDRCHSLVVENRLPRCALCPLLKGALKKTSHVLCDSECKRLFVHPQCVKWFPELTMSMGQRLSPPCKSRNSLTYHKACLEETNDDLLVLPQQMTMFMLRKDLLCL